jgi:hypothetical protein
VARQLHYTSAERGLAGHAGFQYVAESASVTPDVRHVVTPFMSYRPPPRTPPQPDRAQCAQLPISLCYQRVAEHAMLVRCRYLGQDYSGRYGNFLGHAVVAAPQELEGIRPIELWGAPFWAEQPAGATTLPEVGELSPGAEISPDAVLRHLESLGERGYALLGGLLDAVLECLAGRMGRVILSAEAVADVAVWIAALSYSLPFEVAADLSFTTYTADPESAQQRLVGTTPDVVAAITRPGRVFHLDHTAPRTTSPGRFAELAVAAWRRADLAAIDALSEVAGVLGGDLSLAGTLVAFGQGAAPRPEEPTAVVEALGRSGRDVPDWLWESLAAALPRVGADLAAAIYRAADPLRRKEIAGSATAPLRAALVAAEDLPAVVDIVRLAADSGVPVAGGDVVAAAYGCARTGRGDLVADYRECPTAFRPDLLRGFLGGLAVADESVRRALLTPALCDWLVDVDWLAGHELLPEVWASVGRRDSGRRQEMAQRLARNGDRSPVEVAELAAGMWGNEIPTPEECLEISGTAGTAVCAQPPMLALFGRVLATGRLQAAGTTELADTVVRLATEDGSAVTDAHLIQELVAVKDALGNNREAVSPLLRLDRYRLSGSPRLVDAVVRAVARELLTVPVNVRTGLFGKASSDLRSGISRAWAELDYRPPPAAADLAATVLTLRRQGVRDANLEQLLLRLVQRKSTRHHVQDGLRRTDSKLLKELDVLMSTAEPERRGVFGRFTRKHDN